MPTLRTLGPAASAPAERPSRTPIALEVGPSGIEGTGVFARQAIPARAKVGEIRGESIPQKEAFARARAAQRDSGHVFMIALSDKRSLDATHSTDPLRFANHHCEPNLNLKVEQGRVAFYALRDIADGEELTVRYGPTHHAGRLVCRCGSMRCQGWL